MQWHNKENKHRIKLTSLQGLTTQRRRDVAIRVIIYGSHELKLCTRHILSSGCLV